jgi:LPS-assembly lipoprotein
MKKIIAGCLIALTLSACGWQLRGSMELPKNLSHLYVSAIDSRGALITDLRQLLKTNRVTLVASEAEAQYSLAILEETKDRRTVGIGGDALSSAYEITRKTNYEIRLKNSEYTTKGTAISVRSFNYNTTAINSATQEENLLDQEMRRDIAQQMLRRLNAVITNPDSNANTNTKTKTKKTATDEHGKTAP